MTERKQVKIYNHLLGQYGTRNLSDFIQELQELQSEGWEKIELGQRSESGCESDYWNLQATKNRPETDDEYNKRIAQEEKMRKARRNAYEILKKEFG